MPVHIALLGQCRGGLPVALTVVTNWAGGPVVLVWPYPFSINDFPMTSGLPRLRRVASVLGTRYVFVIARDCIYGWDSIENDVVCRIDPAKHLLWRGDNTDLASAGPCWLDAAAWAWLQRLRDAGIGSSDMPVKFMTDLCADFPDDLP